MTHNSPLSFATRFLLPSARCLLPTVLLLLTAHWSLLTVFGQSSTATLSGQVADERDAVIPGASVAVVNANTGARRQTTTNDEGYFIVPLLPPSTYIVNFQRQGFAPVEVRNVILNVGDQKALQIQLKTGNVSETVQVTNDASLVDESPAVGTVVDRQFVENLPLNGRSFQSLIALTPGVVLTKANVSEQGQFSVNGQRANANYFTVDGVSANVGVGPNLGQSAGGALPALNAGGGTSNLVSVDALQEFKVQTSTYAPEFGRTPGAQVQILTRSGTNQFRGILFEYFRNEALDANDWFNNSRRLKKPALRQNDFGGVFGGPIIKNRTFFFLSYEGLRLRLPQTQITAVPTVNARQSAPSPIQPLLKAFPLPNGKDLANGLAEFNASYSDPTTLNATSIRIDHTISSKLTLFGRYNYAPSETLQRGLASSLSTMRQLLAKTQTLTTGATWAITPTISNEFRANYSRTRGAGFLSLDNFGGATPPLDSEIFPSFASSKDSFFSFSLGSGISYSLGKNADNLQRQVNLVNNVAIATGSHQLKFGVDYRRLSPFYGIRRYDLLPIFRGVAEALTGRAFFIFVQSRAPADIVLENLSLFGQDAWRATPRLMLTYGLRWEVNPPPTGRLFTVNGLDNPATMTLAPQGTPLWETTYGNFAPRVGLAYHLSQRRGRETVLRGGFGIFYDLGAGWEVGNAPNGGPNSRSKLVFGVLLPPNPSQVAPPPFSLDPPYALTIVFDPNLQLPRTYQWNFNVEQSLGSNQTISAAYVGATGRRLLRQEQLFNPNPNFQRVDVTRSNATSDYNAMQLQFQRRLSRGLQTLASYTWSHSIDTASNDSASNTPSAIINPRQDRGSSDFDIRHAFSAAVTYDIPSQNLLGAVGSAFLRNWGIDTIITARSATPVNVVTGTGILGVADVFRPDLNPGAPLYLDDPTVGGGRRINRAAFAIPPAGRQGTLGRNALRGFPMWQVDLALRRQFNLTERVNLQFRAEFFNIFNHPNFADPIPPLNNPLFGESVQMLGRSLGGGGAAGGFSPLYQVGGPRSVQLALKLVF